MTCGFEMNVCLLALNRNQQNPDAAMDWLLTGGEEVDNLVASEAHNSTTEDRIQLKELEEKKKEVN